MSPSNSPSPEDLQNRVLSALSTASWTKSTPVDQLPTYMARANRSHRIQTFGPSPGSEKVMMWAKLTANLEAKPVIAGRATHRLNWAGERLMRELEPLQITHRSRPAGLMSSRLQANELKRRVDAARTNMQTLTSISLPESIAEEICKIKKNALLKRFKMDDKTIAKYVKEHEKSSIIPGVKWGALPAEKSWWTEYYNTMKGYIEDGYFSGNWNAPFNFGGRQRADQQVEKGEIHYDLEVTRTRVVMFHPALSSTFMFVPDKQGFYKEVWDSVLDVFEINDHVMCPFVHGGAVYGQAAASLKDGEKSVIVLGDDVNIYQGGKQYAFDGVNWETQVGTILGKPFHGSKTFFGGMYHVPSGVYDTSLDDTIASLWVYSQNNDLVEGVNINGIMEREEMDEKTNFMLGLSYAEDPLAPRLQGLKLTVDKADKSLPLPQGRNLEIKSKYEEDVIERWYLAYHGTTPTGGTLLDFLETIKPEDFRGGEISDMIQNSTL